jgi:oligosaccharide repeat unit polymerase
MKIFLIIIYFVVVFFPIFFEIKNKKFDFLNLKNAFLLYLFLQIGLYEIVQSALDVEPSWYRPSDYYVNYSIFMALSGTIFFNLFYYFTPKLYFSRGSTKYNDYKIRNVLMGSILVIFGYSMFLALLYINGGLLVFINNLQSWRTVGVSGQGIFIFPATVGLSIGALLFASKYSSSQVRSKGNINLIVLALIVALIPAAIIGFRGLLLAPIFYWLIVFKEEITSNLNKKWSIMIVLIIALIFTLFGMYRQWNEVVEENLSFIKGVATILDVRPALVFDVFLRSRGTDVVGTVISKLNESNQFIGVSGSIAEAISILVPRYFTDKPLPMSVHFSKIFFDANGGFSPTTIGELYWMGGELAVVIGMSFLGIFAKTIYYGYLRNKINLYFRIAYGILFVQFALMAEAIQGNLNAMVMTFSFYMIILFLLKLKFNSKKIKT